MGRIAPHQGTRRRRQVLGGAPRAVQAAHPGRPGSIFSNAGHPQAPFSLREPLLVSYFSRASTEVNRRKRFAANIELCVRVTLS